MSEVNITPERIRQFALDGGLTEEAATHFLDSQCHILQMRNLPAQVAEDAFSPIMEVGLVVGCQESNEKLGSLHLGAWVPFDHSQRIMREIREIHKRHGIECPHEFSDFETLDTALCGKDYILAMLMGYVRIHGKLP